MDPIVSPVRRGLVKASTPLPLSDDKGPIAERSASKVDRMGGISVRSLLVGMLLAVPNTYWITVVEVRWYTLDGTCLPLFITPIFFLFCLVLLNLAVRRAAPARADRLAFTQAEL